MKLKILFHGFSNASVWYLSGLNLVSYAVDEIAGLNHLSIHILQKIVFIVLQVSENQDELLAPSAFTVWC
jgi:hypothetical protein